jgi:RNA polymerase sigma factor (sigma-70 family)
MPDGALPAESLDDTPETFGVTVVSRAYHADLLAAVRKVGSVKALAEHLGVCEQTVHGWLNLRSFPDLSERRTGKRWAKRWPEIERKLVELTGKGGPQLFPGFVKLSGILDAPKATETTREFTAGDMIGSRHEPAALLPAPERALDLESLRERLDEVLATLSWREREVVRLRYGLGGDPPLTLEEVARIFRVTSTRVRQIEEKAVRRLQHPERVAALLPFEGL